jgi:hypothetical protein
MADLALLLFIYKLVSLLCGLFVIYLGYKLFIKGIFNESGDVEAVWESKKILVKKAAPGTFFALFGAIVMGVSIFRGLTFESATQPSVSDLKTVKIPPPLDDSINFSKDTSKIK